ncbi:hypothetical protein BLA29_013771, partial [Euroglyphus maynei]
IYSLIKQINLKDRRFSIIDHSNENENLLLLPILLEVDWFSDYGTMNDYHHPMGIGEYEYEDVHMVQIPGDDNGDNVPFPSNRC